MFISQTKRRTLREGAQRVPRSLLDLANVNIKSAQEAHEFPKTATLEARTTDNNVHAVRSDFVV